MSYYFQSPLKKDHHGYLQNVGLGLSHAGHLLLAQEQTTPEKRDDATL